MGATSCGSVRRPSDAKWTSIRASSSVTPRDIGLSIYPGRRQLTPAFFDSMTAAPKDGSRTEGYAESVVRFSAPGL